VGPGLVLNYVAATALNLLGRMAPRVGE
jgi:hypothetical protein